MFLVGGGGGGGVEREGRKSRALILCLQRDKPRAGCG